MAHLLSLYVFPMPLSSHDTVDTPQTVTTTHWNLVGHLNGSMCLCKVNFNSDIYYRCIDVVLIANQSVSQSLSVVRSREVRISEVRDVCNQCLWFVCSTEVVRISEGPLRKVPLYY